jgi:hypothetical protein
LRFNLPQPGVSIIRAAPQHGNLAPAADRDPANFPGPAILNRHVATVEPSKFAEPLNKGGNPFSALGHSQRTLPSGPQRRDVTACPIGFYANFLAKVRGKRRTG